MSDAAPAPEPHPPVQPAPTAPTPGATSRPANTARDDLERPVYIREYAKVVFLYPTFIAALIAGLWTWAGMGDAELQGITLGPGRLFWLVFSVNMLTLAFDFGRGQFVLLMTTFILAVLVVILLDREWQFAKPVAAVLGHIQLKAHPHMYYLFAVTLGVIFVVVFIYTRFEYWELTHNELLHHHGLFGNVERYPSPNLRMTKEITDVFEFVLAGSGRLVLQPQGTTRAIVLDNVLFVNRIEKRIQHMLGSLKVSVDHGSHHHGSDH